MKNKRYDLIIFDWDGTIVDSFSKIIRCIQDASIKLGWPVPHANVIRPIIGLSFKDAWTTLFPSIPIKYHDIFLNHYSEEFFEERDDSKLFEPVISLLDTLTDQNYLLAVATGKGRRGLDHELHTHNLGHYFLTTKTTTECFSKPHPQMVEEILHFTGLEPHQALVIGDSIYDMQMAYNARVDGIHITSEKNIDYGDVKTAIKHQIECLSEAQTILCQEIS
jgi:phosphoglycolate phosphatase